jgi:hypothetical protein
MEYSSAFRVWATVESVASAQPTEFSQHYKVNGQDCSDDDSGYDCDGFDSILGQ